MKECFVSGVLNATPVWVEENGIIRTSVISDGTTGEQWVDRTEEKGDLICSEAKNILLSSRFVSTSGVRTEIAIFRSNIISFEERYTINVHEVALSKGLAIPGIEVTCLLRDKLSNEDLEIMRLWWIAVMHTPVRTFEGGLSSLGIDRYGDKKWIYAHGAKDYNSWDDEGGFAFAIPS